MQIQQLTFLLLLLFLLASCGGEQGRAAYLADDELRFEREAMPIEAPRTAEPPAPDAQPEVVPAEKASKIIRNGRMRVEVQDLAQAKKQMDEVVQQLGGYYETEDYRASDYQAAYELRIRVPAERFDSLLTIIEGGQGRILSRSITAQDVTETYIDLSTRLENSRAYLKQYRELLDKAKSVEELLEIQEKIRGLEEEMEARQGRLRYLEDQVAYSRLDMELFEPFSQSVKRPRRQFGNQLVEAFSAGISWFLDLLVVLVRLWPLLPLIVLAIVFRKRIWRRLKG